MLHIPQWSPCVKPHFNTNFIILQICQHSKLLIKGLMQSFLLPLILGGYLACVCSHQFSHSAAHVSRQLAFYESSVQTYSSDDYDDQCDDRDQDDYDNVTVGLVGRHLDLLGFCLAVSRWGGKTRANGLNYVTDLEVATIDHVVNGYFRETVESKQDFSGPPNFQRFFGVDIVSILNVHLLDNVLDALIEIIPISIAVLIEQVHILKPLLRSTLRKNGHLVELLPDDLLTNILLPVFIIKAAVISKIAVIVTAGGTSSGLIKRLKRYVVLELEILLFEGSQEDV